MTAAPMTAADGARLWVVVGCHGEYSDRSEWPVCVCPNEAMAKAYVEAAERRAREIESSMDAAGLSWLPAELRSAPRFSSTLDPDHGGLSFSTYDQTTYYASEAPLRLTVPTPTGRDTP